MHGPKVAMCHRLSGLSTYGLKGLRQGDEHPPPTLSIGHGTFTYLPYVLRLSCLIPEALISQTAKQLPSKIISEVWS